MPVEVVKMRGGGSAFALPPLVQAIFLQKNTPSMSINDGDTSLTYINAAIYRYLYLDAPLWRRTFSHLFLLRTTFIVTPFHVHSFWRPKSVREDIFF